MKSQFIFKQKILATLIASALSVTTANTHAAECNTEGNKTTANGALAVATGPLSPIDGFPEYVTDSTGASVQRCLLDEALCIFDPIVATDPFSVQIGSGGEAFYWSADAVVSNAAGTNVLTLGLAAETAFLGTGPNGEPINGTQFPFLRLRIDMGVPVDGTYTVKQPYGTNIFTVVGSKGKRDVFFTDDRGFAPNEKNVIGSVAPFLKSVSAPDGYMGDPNVSDWVTGSPCSTNLKPWNYVEVSGVDTLNNPVDFGNGEFVLRTDKFNVQGKIYDERVQTPLTATRLSYSRSANGPAQIDIFANSPKTATVTATDGPTNPVGSATIGGPLTLDRSAINSTDAVDSLSILVATESAANLPSIVQLTASDAQTDNTSLNLPLLDFVDIAQADYDPTLGILSVAATSSDERLSPILTLRDFGNFTAGTPIKMVSTTAPPGEVHVDSAAGGTAVAKVRVMDSVVPNAPTNLELVTATSTTLRLKWVDTDTNEQGFNVYQVVGVTRTLKTTVVANTVSAVISDLSPNQSYTFQVEAFNLAGHSSPASVDVQTLALPVAPTGVAASLSTTATRAINVSWTDNSGDETGFAISRSTSEAGDYTPVATAPAGATTVVDTTGQNNTTYFYRVVALRGADSSNTAQSTVALTTPTVPVSAIAVTFGTVNTNSVVVNWIDRATNETSFQVYRATVTGTVIGNFAAVSSVLPANTVTFTDTGLPADTVYRYRVDVSNWAGVVVSANSVSVTTTDVPNLFAPTNLAVTTAALRPVLTWIDTSTGETNYRVKRTPITVNLNGSITAGTPVIASSTVAANAFRFTDTPQSAKATLLYDVGAFTATTTGALAKAYTVIGGLPTVTQQALTRSPTSAIRALTNPTTVTVRWLVPGTAAAQAPIGGYEVQRCSLAACTNFTKLTGTAVNTAGTVDGRSSLHFVDNNVARLTVYRYRIRPVGGAGTSQLGTFSDVVDVTTL